MEKFESLFEDLDVHSQVSNLVKLNLGENCFPGCFDQILVAFEKF